MHQKCAATYVKKFSPHCSMCQQKVQTANLDPAPEPTREERRLASEQKQLRRARDLAWRAHFHQWDVAIWPSVAHAFRFQRPSGARALFLHMSMQDYQDAFRQRHMDRGRSRDEADDFIASLLVLSREFDALSPKTRSVFHAGIVRGFAFTAQRRREAVDLEAHLRRRSGPLTPHAAEGSADALSLSDGASGAGSD
tara:strand:+ start:379 stop:966 length:588 start_codon:yes stop_codon:yes gene_type:complete